MRKRLLAQLLWAFSALLLIAGLWLNRTDTAVKLSVPSQVGSILQTDFSVRRSADYLIEIQYNRSMPINQLKDLITSQPWVNVTLSQNGQPVPLSNLLSTQAQPNTAVYPFGDTSQPPDWQQAAGTFSVHGNRLTQPLGTFDATSGAQYVISCAVLRTSPKMTSIRPTLIVQEHPHASEGRLFLAGLLIALGVASTIGAVVVTAACYRAGRVRVGPESGLSGQR